MAERSPDIAALDRIFHELRHAERKHPGWPTDPVRQVAVVMEEAGEALQATLNMVETKERMDAAVRPGDAWKEIPPPHMMEAVLKEVAQTGAMALRFLINYERRLYAESEATREQGFDQATG